MSAPLLGDFVPDTVFDLGPVLRLLLAPSCRTCGHASPDGPTCEACLQRAEPGLVVVEDIE